MAVSLAEPGPRPTIVERVYAAVPLSPLWVGLGTAVVLFLLYLVTGELSGAFDLLRARGGPLWQVPIVREAALLSILFSYALTAEEMAAYREPFAEPAEARVSGQQATCEGLDVVARHDLGTDARAVTADANFAYSGIGAGVRVLDRNDIHQTVARCVVRAG